MTAPQDPYSYPGAPGGRPARSGAQLFSYLAIASGVLALLISPLIFGIIGVVLAIVANRRGEPLWKIALAVVIVGAVVGIIVGAVILSNT
jgi:hypothetical protein